MNLQKETAGKNGSETVLYIDSIYSVTLGHIRHSKQKKSNRFDVAQKEALLTLFNSVFAFKW